MDIQVSVISTVYNHEKYIRQALQSIVDQITNFPFEVIVHDDASTDGSAEIIKEFEEKYPDIIKPIYQTENIHSQGIKSSEFTIPKTRGKYIALCEGDDFWTDNSKLQRQFDFLESHPDYVLVAHQCDVVNERGEYMHPFSKRMQSVYEKGEVLLDTNAFQTATMFYRKSAVEQNSEFLKSVSSFDYVLKSVFSTEGKTYILPQTMSAYRQASDGSWTVRIFQNKTKRIAHIKQSIAFFEKLDAYRNGEFHDLISQQIRRRELNILVAEHSKNAFKKIIREYGDLYREMSFKTRVYWRILSVIGK